MGWRFAWFQLRYGSDDHVSGYLLDYDRFASDNLKRIAKGQKPSLLYWSLAWFLLQTAPWEHPSLPLYWVWKLQEIEKTSIGESSQENNT